MSSPQHCNMHDELIPRKMLTTLTCFDSIKSSAPISPPISMKRKFAGGVDRSYYSPQLTSSDVSSNEEHLEEDDDLESGDCGGANSPAPNNNNNNTTIVNNNTTTIATNNNNNSTTTTMPRRGGASSYILKNGSLKGPAGKLNNAPEISLPSPPSSTTSSLDNDHVPFMAADGQEHDFCSYDSDIILEGCKMLTPEDELTFATDIQAVLSDLVDKTVEEAIQDEIWGAVKISLDGETILPNGHRLYRGVAQMEYYTDSDTTPRFTNQLNFLKNILQKNILRYKAAAPFLNPVNSIELKIPHYYQIVREPMDLSTIKHRLNFLYYQSAAECIADIRLILDNCFKFNAPQDFVYKSGKRFEEFLNEKLKDLPEEEVEIACPAKPSPDEYFKEKDHRPFKRMDPILQEASILKSSLPSTPSIMVAPKIEAMPTTPLMASSALQAKYSTRSARGLKLKKPTKDLTTYTEAAAAAASASSTPEMPKLKLGKKVQLNDALRWCHDFVKELFTKKHEEYAWPFYRPVDLNQFPDYTRAIKTPIDLSTIKALIETGGYETVTRFATAMRLMFSNCIRYNPPESPIIEQARKLRDLFELRFANIPEEYLKMKLEIPGKSTPSSSRNVSPSSSSRSKSSKTEPIYVTPVLPSNIEKLISNKKRKDRSHRDERRDSKKLKRSSSSYEKADMPTTPLTPMVVEGQNMKLEELQQQINTLTLALQTALQGGGATNEAKRLLNQITGAEAHAAAISSSAGPTPAKRGRKKNSEKLAAAAAAAKRHSGPPVQILKPSRPRHLSSSESSDSEDDDDDVMPTSSFHPTSRDDLTKLKADLEELPASDIHNLFSILCETEPSLKSDDAHIEIDFETLSSQTLIRLRKYVDSVKLNLVRNRK